MSQPTEEDYAQLSNPPYGGMGTLSHDVLHENLDVAIQERLQRYEPEWIEAMVAHYRSLCATFPSE